MQIPQYFMQQCRKMAVPILFLLLSSSAVGRQQIDSLLYGQVLSSGTNQPVSGASVRYKKVEYTAHTDDQGRFRIKKSSLGDSLIVSFIGYTPEVISVKQALANKPFTLHLLPVNTDLHEVVVSTGYQVLPQERATGSFERVDQSILNRRVSKDLLSRLEGTTTILFDNRSKEQQMLVRGRSTLFANNAPLIVVDNFPFDGDIGQINPGDIESVTLLKDAAAASIWGVRAGNGVLVITTKKGRYNKPFRMEVASNVTLTDKPDLFRDHTMATGDFIDVEKKLFKSGFYNADMNNILKHPLLSPVVEILEKGKQGLLTPEQVETELSAFRNYDIRNDYKKYLYRVGMNQQYTMNFSGGSPAASYYFSAGYDNQQNSLIRNRFERISLRSDNTFRPIKRLELQVGLLYSYSKTTNNNPGPEGLIPGAGKQKYYPYARLADENGIPLSVSKDYRTSYVDTIGSGLLQDWKYRPLQELNLADNNYYLNNYRFNLGGRYNLTPWLNAELRYQYERQEGSMKNLYDKDAYYSRNLVNLFTVIEGKEVNYGIPKGGILDMSDDLLTTHSTRGQLNYSQSWNNKHQVAALAGMEIKQSRSQFNSNRTYGYDQDLLTFSNVDYKNYLPTYQNLQGNMQIYNPADFNDLLYHFVSYYANVSYTYDNRYIVSASARKDASNLFGVKSNQKGVPLWSAGLRWNISNEAYFKSSLLPMLAARITYGYSGNTNNRLSAYTIITYGAAGDNFLINVPFAVISTPPNPSLRWEKTAILNMAVDFRMINDILSGSVEYYRKTGTDLIGNTPVDPTTGLSNVDKNSACIKGQGVDLNLRTILINRKIRLEANLLLSYNTNKITRYLYRYTKASSYISTGVNPLEGKPTDAILSYRWEGLDNEGNPQGWLNGKVSKDYSAIRSKSRLDDLVYSGRSLPPLYGALRPQISYKRWTLSANVTYKFGHYFRRNSINYTALYQGWNGHDDYALRWKKPGDEKITSVPAMVYPAGSYRDDFYLQSAVLVAKADLIRWKDINIQYTLTPNKKTPFQQIQCYLYLDNIGVLYRANKFGIDPEYGVSVPPRGFSFGIKASF